MAVGEVTGIFVRGDDLFKKYQSIQQVSIKYRILSVLSAQWPQMLISVCFL